KKIACSNRICLCVPRFILTRGETLPVGQLALVGPRNTVATQAQVAVKTLVGPLQERQREQPALVTSRMRPSVNLATLGAVAIGQLEGATVVSAVRETGSVTGSCPPPHPAVPEKLKLIKWADRCAAAVGDVVTFFLKYTNCGGLPITSVAVSDSLTARL